MVSRAMEMRKDIGKMEKLLPQGLVQRTLQSSLCLHGTVHRRPLRMKEAPSPSMDLLPLWIARLHCTFLPQTPVYLVRRLPQREP